MTAHAYRDPQVLVLERVVKEAAHEVPPREEQVRYRLMVENARGVMVDDRLTLWDAARVFVIREVKSRGTDDVLLAVAELESGSEPVPLCLRDEQGGLKINPDFDLTRRGR